LGPERLLEDTAIEFDCDACGVELQLFEQREDSLSFGDGARLAVENDL
jgi:hypothetical protein